MNLVSTLYAKIREAVGRMIPYRSIEQAERIETPLTVDMTNAVEKWYQMYLDQAPWVDREAVFSLNLPAFISGEIARQVLLEVKWNITGKNAAETGEEVMNPRAEYLKAEFEKLIESTAFRAKLEQGCAAGGMIIKPYPNTETGHIHFDWAMDWGFYPIAFDDDGNLTDFIIPDVFREGKTIYTRLERHTVINGRGETDGDDQGAGDKTPSAEKQAREGAQQPNTDNRDESTQERQEDKEAEQADNSKQEQEKRTGAPQRQPQAQRKITRSIRITQRAFKSSVEDSLGREINLDDVPRWEHLQPEAIVTETEAPLIGWFKVAASNTVDVDSPLGASVYARAADTIKQADMQYSRILWEYEASEMAIDVDPSALRPRKVAGGVMEMPKLNQRLFRAVDIDKGDRDLYEVFAPQIRDSALFVGLNNLLMRIEDQCGLSRGTISDANVEPRTATELKIVRARSYQTITDNQRALEKCLKDVVAAMDRYATIYNLAPEGEYDVSFEWDDSILTDTDQQTQERLMLMNSGIMSKVEFRMWYFGETRAQAEAAIASVNQEKTDAIESMNPMLPQFGGGPEAPQSPGNEEGEEIPGEGQENPENQPDGGENTPENEEDTDGTEEEEQAGGGRNTRNNRFGRKKQAGRKNRNQFPPR